MLGKSACFHQVDIAPAGVISTCRGASILLVFADQAGVNLGWTLASWVLILSLRVLSLLGRELHVAGSAETAQCLLAAVILLGLDVIAVGARADAA
jgi:hypothetical protein